MATEGKSYHENPQMHRMLGIPGPVCPDTGSWQLKNNTSPCFCLGYYPGGSVESHPPTCPEGVFDGDSCTCACPDGEIFNDSTGKCEIPPPPPGVDPSCPDSGSWSLKKNTSPCICLGSYPGGSVEGVPPTCPAGLYYVEDLCRCTCLGKAFDNNTNTCMDPVVCPTPKPATTMSRACKSAKSGQTQN